MKRIILLALGLLIAGSAWAALTPIQQLGKNIFFDNISAGPPRQSCSSCHAPAVGWVGPVAGVNQHGAVYAGAEPRAFGNRKPPSSAYATFNPNFHWDADAGEFIGGIMWDGRATGELRGSPTADQALGPFAAAPEQNIDLMSVCEVITNSGYADLFEQVWGPGSLDCGETGYAATADKVAWSIAAYEASEEVNPFSSKFDAYWRRCMSAGNSAEDCGSGEEPKAVLDPDNILTEQEYAGLIEFGEYCSACHESKAPGPNGLPPLFTTFAFDNVGAPKNPENPVYDTDPGWIDLGLGGFLRTRAEWQQLAAENDGKMKIPSVRNVDLRRGSEPKAYAHNGYFKSLKDIVHFYNTRDVASANWPAPEVSANLSTELLAGKPLGDLQLDEFAEDAIVAFLGTLSDGWKPKKGAKPVVSLGDARFHLGTVSPNPTHGTFRIEFALADATPTTLAIYDVMGRQVAARDVGMMGAGKHSVIIGNPRLAPGIYLVKLNRADASLVTRAIVIR